MASVMVKLIDKVEHTSPTATAMTCGVNPIPAEPESHAPMYTNIYMKYQIQCSWMQEATK